MSIESYDKLLQTYEDQYQHQLEQFQGKLQSIMHLDSTTIYHSLLTYLNHRQNRLKMDIYQENISIYRKRMFRLSQYVQDSSATKQNQKRQKKKKRKKNNNHVNVAPQVIIDLKYHPFTAAEIAYLSRGKIFFYLPFFYLVILR